jgi:hypothetical protein
MYHKSTYMYSTMPRLHRLNKRYGSVHFEVYLWRVMTYKYCHHDHESQAPPHAHRPQHAAPAACP